jgi:glycosyltransferase involved in cell wall biosynthesis
MSSSAPPTFSLIIPFYNEAENIYAVLTEACLVMEALGETYELLAVDDGSTDATRLTAHKMTQEWPFLRVLAFDKNRGQAA